MNDFDDIGACIAEQDFYESEYPELAELEQDAEFDEVFDEFDF
jgi:hypothetical protein